MLVLSISPEARESLRTEGAKRRAICTNTIVPALVYVVVRAEWSDHRKPRERLPWGTWGHNRQVIGSSVVVT